MPGGRTVQFVVAFDASQYERGIAQVEQSGGRLVTTQQRMDTAVKTTTGHLQQHGAAGREAFLVVGQAMDATGAKVGPLATAFYRIDMIFDALNNHGSRLSNVMTGVGVAMLAAGGLIVSAAAKEQAATKDLQQAVESSGHSWAAYRDELEKTAAAQAQFGTSKTTALGALATLTRASQDPTKAMHDLAEAQDLAAAKHIPLQDAAQALAAVYGGNTRILQSLGINVKNLVDPTKELTKAQHDQASAAEAMSTAQQHLSDVQARVAQAAQQAQETYQSKLASAQQAEETANQRLSDSTLSLADARQHLRDVEDQIHEATQLSISDIYSQTNAQIALSDINDKIATGELRGQAAYTARRDAERRLAEIQAENAQKQKVSISQSHQLRDAHEGVTKAVTAEARAHEAANKAHEKTQAIRKAGPAPISLALQQEEAAAERGYEKAKARVDAANAEMAKAKADMDAFPSRVQQILDQVDQRVHGAAEDQANTINGMFKRWYADAENFFSKFGARTGTALTVAGAGLTIFSALTQFRSARAIGALAGVAGAEDGVAASAVGMDAALGPIALIAGAVIGLGIIIWALWHNWDKIWHWISHHKAYAALIAVLVPITGPIIAIIGAVKYVQQHWSAIWADISKVAHHVANDLTDVFNALVWTYNHTVGLIPGMPQIEVPVVAKGTAVSAMGGLKVTPTASTAMGGLSFTPVTPPVNTNTGRPRFGTGGIVPGPRGSEQTIIAHGGEVVVPTWRAGQVRGGDGMTLNLTVNVSGAMTREDAYRFGLAAADGVHDALLIKKRNGNPKLGLD